MEIITDMYRVHSIRSLRFKFIIILFNLCIGLKPNTLKRIELIAVVVLYGN